MNLSNNKNLSIFQEFFSSNNIVNTNILDIGQEINSPTSESSQILSKITLSRDQNIANTSKNITGPLAKGEII